MTDVNQRSDNQPEYTTLTDDQLARLPAYLETWSEHALCTAPADRPRAEAAVRFIYRQEDIAKLEDETKQKTKKRKLKIIRRNFRSAIKRL